MEDIGSLVDAQVCGALVKNIASQIQFNQRASGHLMIEQSKRVYQDLGRACPGLTKLIKGFVEEWYCWIQ